MSYYQTTARVDRIMENGEQKNVSEKYLVDAMTCFEAIELTTSEIQNTTSEFEITEVKKTPIAETFGNMEADKFFFARVNFIQLDEKSGKEKKSRSLWLIGADEYDTAKAVLTDVINKFVEDIEIAGLVESPIVGYIPYRL